MTPIDTARGATNPGSLIACHECDLLQVEPAMPSQGTALCARCSAVLYRTRPDAANRALAYAMAAAVAFVLANTFPLVGLRVKGDLIETTLFGTAKALYEGDMRTVAAVVFVTVVVAPLIQLIALARLLLPMKFPTLPPAGPRAFRALRAIMPWGMVEVLMLGVLVALVKLAHMAEVIIGVAMWAVAALVVLLAAAASNYDAREVWAFREARQ